MNIKVLDCTLRDGGHVNQGKFGKKTIEDIILCLTKSKIDMIELGFLRDGSFTEEQALYNTIEQIVPYLPEHIKEQEYSVMIRPDWYDISQLSACNNKINNIRFAFYYKDIELTEKYCSIAKEKGYNIYLNPVNIMSYKEKELENLLIRLNHIKPSAVTIVDTFGAIEKDDLIQIYNQFETILSKDITIGLHLHENMLLGYSLIQEFLKLKKKERTIILDGSLNGMGRIPGNLSIEMLVNYLNKNYDKTYSVEPVLYAISHYIIPIKQEILWGYSPAYYFTAEMKMHRSYAEYLLEKNDLDLRDIYLILNQIKNENDKNYFKLDLIKKIYETYEISEIKGKGMNK